MAQGPENRFIARVHRKLAKDVYHMKNHNQYVGGVPDVYYEGNSDSLWVEYKYWASVKRSFTPEDIVSELQHQWIQRAHNNNVSIAIIVGYKKGGVIIRPDEPRMLGSQFKELVQPIEAIANWIEGKTINAFELDRNTGRAVRARHDSRDN